MTIRPACPLLALALALSPLSCTPPLQARGATPSGAGRNWTSVTTPHFVLRTDLSPSDAESAATKLEEMFSALAELGFPSTDRPAMSIDVVYFREHDDYARLRPDVTAGKFIASGLHDYERRPTAVLGGDFLQSTKRVLLHELTHLFVHYYYPKAPIWLNEGLAKYFEVLSLDDGVAILGRPQRDARFWKGPWRSTGDAWNRMTWIPVGEAPTVSRLHVMAEDFYGDVNVDTTTSSGHEVIRTMIAHYQAAWCLVHFLLEDPTYAPAFTDYLSRIHAGESDATAWDATLGTLPQEALEASYRESLSPREVTTRRTRFAPPPSAAPTVRAMDDREVRVLWARLRDWSNADARGAAARELEAPGADPGNVEEATSEAFWQESAGNRAVAEQLVRSALAINPSDRQLLNALGWILLHGAPGDAKDLGAKLAAVTASLDRIAESAAELDLLAQIDALGGHFDDALAHEKRAIAADPSCKACLFFTAQILGQKGLYREAFETAMLSVNPDAELPPSVAATLEGWRRRAASHTPPPAVPRPGSPALVPHADAVLAAMRARFHVCFAGGARPPPGAVDFDLNVDAHGAVTAVQPRPGASFSQNVVECLAGILKAGHFPAPGADTTLNVPIRVNGT